MFCSSSFSSFTCASCPLSMTAFLASAFNAKNSVSASPASSCFALGFGARSWGICTTRCRGGKNDKNGRRTYQKHTCRYFSLLNRCANGGVHCVFAGQNKQNARKKTANLLWSELQRLERLEMAQRCIFTPGTRFYAYFHEGNIPLQSRKTRYVNTGKSSWRGFAKDE